MKRRIKYILKRVLFSIYKLGTRFRIHILPVHYYSSIPNIIELGKTKNIWAKKSGLPGLEIDLDRQANNIKNICMPYQSEYQGNKAYRYAVENTFGPGYGYIEAQALHGVTRHLKPKRVVEVGSGVSTWCMLTALNMNKEETGEDFNITCIEPFPSSQLKALEEIKLIPKPVQTVSFDSLFQDLGRNDFLFIDSSHTVKPGSDVNYLVLEILPRLNAGVIVHFHDIFLPYDYSPGVLENFWYWMETSLLRAFLVNNSKVKIIFCQSHLHYDRKEVMKEIFPEYDPQPDNNGIQEEKYRPYNLLIEKHFPSSIYFQIQ